MEVLAGVLGLVAAAQHQDGEQHARHQAEHPGQHLHGCERRGQATGPRPVITSAAGC